MTAETNAERLKNIKIHFDVYESGYGISPEMAEWLIQQAERAAELEREIDTQIGDESVLNRTIGGLRSENARLQKEIQTMRHHILNVCNNVGAFPKSTVKDYVQGVFKDYLPQEDSK